VINNPFMMVAVIVVAVMVASVLKARYKFQNDGGDTGARPSTGETQRLRAEVAELKERLAVLERITVEKENSLARQIDELRDQ
jgi:hypothetical protein